MTTTLQTTARNASCNGTVDLVDAGSGPGKFRIRAGATTICDITLAKPAFSDAGVTVAGRADCAGLPLVGISVAVGTPDNYQILDSDNVAHWAGSVGTSGSGADAIIDVASVIIGQAISLLSFSHTQPP